MIRQLSLVIAWGSFCSMFILGLFGIYYLVFIESFFGFVRSSFPLPIQWQTVTPWQLYSLWAVLASTTALSIAGFYFLWRAFSRFAAGELFTDANSRAVRMFAIFLFLQALVSPVRFAIASVILSANHPPGQRMLSISVEGENVQTIAYGLILWIVSELLIAAKKLESENKQFV